MKNEFLSIAKQIKALSENGLYYSECDYDTDRYENLKELSLKMMELLSNEEPQKIKLLLSDDDGYRTPKVDVRGVVFNENGEILLVKEKIDGNWSLPGGWCDIGYSARETVEKEVWEEAGIKVKADKLLAVLDKKFHNHPEDINYVYKLFILCLYDSGKISTGMETLDVGYFSKDNLPPLSTPRNTIEQIEIMFDFYQNKRDEIIFD